MKRNKRIIIAFIIIVLVVVGGIISCVYLLNNENNLTVSEKQWINDNSKIVYNIGVKNDSNIFGLDGQGVFYDFIEDLAEEYDLMINPTTYTNASTPDSEIYFRVTNALEEQDLVVYTDHYVVVSKNNVSISDISKLSDTKIGVLSSDLEIIKQYFSKTNLFSVAQYDSKEKLLSAFAEQKDINYIIVPEIEYLDTILAEDTYINYHLSDIPIYYTLYVAGSDTTLNSILNKYYNVWMEEKFDERYNLESFDFFTSILSISSEDIDKLRSKTYTYGYLVNNPYEVYGSSNYGGIAGVYLEKFINFSSIDVEYTKYKTINSLSKALSNEDIDLYFNVYTNTDEYQTINTSLNVKYYVIASDENNIALSSLKGLKDKDVYVLEDSILAERLSSLNYFSINTYDKVADLKKLVKNDEIIIIDQNNYNYLKDIYFEDYTIRYEESLDSVYNFKSNQSEVFNKLLASYINTLDPALIINEGINSNKVIVQSDTILGRIARYFLIIVLIVIIIGFLVYRSSKKIRIVKKIKREDKMRFIDQLTSLKNRNYLNENINTWNKNNIYPQTTLVIDMNNIQYINDTFGYEQGDLQIQAAANVLIKLQLDNSDIMRTDGTEFLVYLVGYKEKQIVSFMRKLTKEFKKLPYDYGAIMAYSTISDDMKLIEDAINEATLKIKEKKNKKDNDNEIDGEKI